MVRNGKHCHTIVEHTLRLVCALLTQVARKIVLDTAQLFFKHFENLGPLFYITTQHSTIAIKCEKKFPAIIEFVRQLVISNMRNKIENDT